MRGCASQVWLVNDPGEGPDPVLNLRGDSDAHIVRGLVAIVLAIYSAARRHPKSPASMRWKPSARSG